MGLRPMFTFKWTEMVWNLTFWNMKRTSWISHIKQTDLSAAAVNCKYFNRRHWGESVCPELGISCIFKDKNQSSKIRKIIEEKCSRATGNVPWSLMSLHSANTNPTAHDSLVTFRNTVTIPYCFFFSFCGFILIWHLHSIFLGNLMISWAFLTSK